jgi:hypothetical protein
MSIAFPLLIVVSKIPDLFNARPLGLLPASSKRFISTVGGGGFGFLDVFLLRLCPRVKIFWNS